MPVSTADVIRRRCTSPCSFDFRFHHGGNEAAERRLRTDAAPDARRQGWPQPDFFDRKIERGELARIFAEHIAAERHRIFARLARKLVMKHSTAKTLLFGTDTAPEAGRHRRGLGPVIFDVKIGNVIGDVHGAVDGVDVDPLLERRRSQRAIMAAPVTRYFQPTILPPDSVAAMVSR